MALIGTLTDNFSGTTLATGWTANGAGVQYDACYVNVSSNAGAAVYSNLRRSDGWTWSNSAIAFYGVAFPGPSGGTGDAQLWMMDPAPAATVDRAGWEYLASSNQLIARSQTGAGYATTNYATLTYDPVAHRNLRMTHTGTTILFETSPDGLTWTTQGTWAATLPTWTSKTTLTPSIEGSQTSGTNDTVRVRAINIAPAALATTSPTGTDALQRRTLAEVRSWESWLTTNSARGFIGEFGWVTLQSRYGDATQGGQWSALGEAYETELDVANLGGSYWASGREWGNGYPLGAHVGTNVGDPLTIANTDVATVLANHPTRGTGTGTRWRGVALSGWEQGININGGGTVRSGAGYLHTLADFGWLAQNGVDLVRLPMAWERVQPTLSTALDTTALANLDAMLTAARQVGIRVILDLHNYGRYTQSDGTTVVALGGSLTNAQLTDFWTRMSTWVLANATRSGTVLGYGIMNEPHDLTGGAATWQTASQAVVTALRGATTPDTRLLLIGGYQYSSLTSWTTNHASGWITDSSSNFRYEAHHYWDTTSTQGSRSGTYQGSSGILTYNTELTAAQATAQATPAQTLELRSTALTANATTTVTSASFTPAVGDLLVVKATTNAQTVVPQTPTTSVAEVTAWTPRVTVSPTAGSPIRVWTARVVTAGALTVSVPVASTSTAAGTLEAVVERWTNAAVGTGTASSVASSTTPSASITTTTANSAVSWIAGDYNGTTGTATYLGGATNDIAAGPYQASTVLSAYTAYQLAATPGATSYGMSAPTSNNVSLGAIEIVPAGAGTAIPAENASTPAITRGTYGTGTTVTSASFSPPANALLAVIVVVGWNAAPTGTPTVSLADSAGGVWTKAADQLGSTTNYSEIVVFTRLIGATAPGAITVTATSTDATNKTMVLAPRVLTGASGLGTPATSASADAVSLTTTKVNSLAYVAAGSPSSAAVFTPSAATTTIYTYLDTSSGDGFAIGEASARTVTPGATSLGWTGTNTTGAGTPAVAFEVLPASVQTTATDQPSGAGQGAPRESQVGSAALTDVGTGAGQGAPGETQTARPQGPIESPSSSEQGSGRETQAVGSVRTDTPAGTREGSARETAIPNTTVYDVGSDTEQGVPNEAPIESTILHEAPSAEESAAPSEVMLPLPPTLTEGMVGPTELDLAVQNAPQVAEATLRLYGWLGAAFIEGDDTSGYPLLRLCEAAGHLLQDIEDITRDQNAAPGWSAVFDLTRAPTHTLPWLGQAVGVDVDPTIPDPAQRSQIVNESSYKRGTPDALRAVALSWLQGPNPTVDIIERDGNRWTVTVAVYAAQLVGKTYAMLSAQYPTYVALSAQYPAYQNYAVGYSELYQALLQVKPAGLILNLVVRTGPTYAALTARYSAYTDFANAYPTYSSAIGAQPVTS